VFYVKSQQKSVFLTKQMDDSNALECAEEGIPYMYTSNPRYHLTGGSCWGGAVCVCREHSIIKNHVFFFIFFLGVRAQKLFTI
jgi:hypothetical protein